MSESDKVKVEIEETANNVEEHSSFHSIPTTYGSFHQLRNPFNPKTYKNTPRFYVIPQKYCKDEVEMEMGLNSYREIYQDKIEKEFPKNIMKGKSDPYIKSIEKEVKFEPYQTRLNEELESCFKKLMLHYHKEVAFDKRLVVNLKPQKLSKKSLILDLDETLICSLNEAKLMYPKKLDMLNVGKIIIASEDGTKRMVSFCVRPHVEKLLKVLSMYYEIIVFTAAMPEYATPIVDFLDPDRSYIDYVLHRDHCTSFNKLVLKDLRILGNRKLEDMVIVDNSVISFAHNMDNGVYVPSYRGDPNDNKLLPIIDFLQTIVDVTDVRPYVKEFAGIDNLFIKYKEDAEMV